MKTKTDKLCLIMPAYNEAAVIGTVLSGLPKKVTYGGRSITITPLVIDDGSTDGTGDAARSVQGTLVLNHIVNMGVGAATRTGLRYAREHAFNLAATIDADGQHSSRDLVKLIKVALSQPQTDILIGSRMGATGNMPPHKIIGNRILSIATHLMFGVRVADSQSGLKVLSRTAIESLEFRCNDYAFCSEILWQAKRAGLNIGESPIEAIYTPYSQAKGQKSYSGGIAIFQRLLLRRFMEFIA